jgi:hypothetical protein
VSPFFDNIAKAAKVGWKEAQQRDRLAKSHAEAEDRETNMRAARFLVGAGMIAALASGCGPSVPTLVGLSVDEATAVLDEKGVTYVIEFAHSSEAEGFVVGQDPESEDIGRSTEFVSLTVSEHKTLDGVVLFDQSIYTIRSRPTVCTGEETNNFRLSAPELAGGASVQVLNGRGEILSVGRLSDGVHISEALTVGRQSYEVLKCQFSFSVTGIPRADIYQVKIGSREPIPFSISEMEAVGWAIDLVVG